MFWDIVGPVLLIIFTGLALWGILGYIQKDLYPLIVGAVAELLICYIFGGSSIGKLLLMVPLLQLGLAGFIIYKKVNNYKNASE